jgi:hypothetical protein
MGMTVVVTCNVVTFGVIRVKSIVYYIEQKD